MILLPLVASPTNEKDFRKHLIFPFVITMLDTAMSVELKAKQCYAIKKPLSLMAEMTELMLELPFFESLSH